jgi:hypothetical protein
MADSYENSSLRFAGFSIRGENGNWRQVFGVDSVPTLRARTIASDYRIEER